jgi:hypothetical protein
LIASADSIEAITPMMGARMPAVSHVGVAPGGGASLMRHARQAVSPERIVIVWPSAPMQPP